MVLGVEVSGTSRDGGSLSMSGSVCKDERLLQQLRPLGGGSVAPEIPIPPAYPTRTKAESPSQVAAAHGLIGDGHGLDATHPSSRCQCGIRCSG